MTLDAALSYAQRGWPVFPLHNVRDGRCSCGYKCSSPAKHPRTTNGLLDASLDPERIREWWSRFPDANVGIATGNGLTVLDVDEGKGGYDSLEDLGELPPTPVVQTGGGGAHYYFAGDARNGVGIRPGIDVRGTGGYVVGPGSTHISGRRYEWDLITEDLPLAALPPSIVERPRKDPASPTETIIGAGSRNATLASLAGSMRRRGMSQEALLSALLAENQVRCKPPLEEREVEAIVRSVARYQPEPTAEIEIIARSAPEFLAQDIPQARYLVNGIWPEHAIGFCAGPAKSFKSFMVRDLAFSLATGKAFLGRFEVPVPRTVLLIDHESSRAAFSDRIRRAEARFGIAPTLYLISNRAFSLEDPVDVDRLRLEIGSIRPDLTILDPLASFIRGDENSAQQMGAVVRVLRGLRDELGTGFCVVHHVQKSRDGDTTRGGERMRGSSVFYAAAEAGLWVKRVDAEEPRSNVRVELKDGDAPGPFQVLFDPEHGMKFIEPFGEALDQMTRAAVEVFRPLADDRSPYYNKD